MCVSLKKLQITLLSWHFSLPFINCLNPDQLHHFGNANSITDKFHKVSSQMRADIVLHGFLMWGSMGLFMPVAILAIRISTRMVLGSICNRVFFYLHVVFQEYTARCLQPKTLKLMILSALLATAAAVLSLRKFENSFDNCHQRIGLALYGAIWVQALIGFFRPHRGKKERTHWYLVHWILGTIIAVMGIINIYTGLVAFSWKTSASVIPWTILFTAQVSTIAFLYLILDKWEYIRKQGMILDGEAIISSNEETHQSRRGENRHKELRPQACGKRNALQNLFHS